MTNYINRQKTASHKGYRGRNGTYGKPGYPAHGMAARTAIAHAGAKADQKTAAGKQPDWKVFAWLIKIGFYLVEQECADNDTRQKSDAPK